VNAVIAHRRTARAVPLVILAAGAAVPFCVGSYATFQAATALSYMPALLGLTVITGLAGQIALGNGAFFALGAYTTAALVKHYDCNAIVTLPAAAIVPFVAGALLGIPSLRLRGHFLAVLTLTVAVAAPQLLKHFEALTNGVSGLSVVVADPPAWLGLDATQCNYFIALVVAAIAFTATRGISRGHIGRALRALRDNEIVAASFGVEVARLKIVALAYSAALAGLGGGVFAIVVGFIAPENFTIEFAALLIIGLVLGGKSSEWGALIGSLLVVGVPIYAAKVAQTLSGVTFAVLVIGAIFVAPTGLVGLADRLTRDLRHKRTRSENPGPRNATADRAGEIPRPLWYRSAVSHHFEHFEL
jgi:branched-chain amino acid transport system permease protein